MPESPDSSLITQLGLGAVIALIIIREVFSFLKSRNSNSHKPMEMECIRSIARIENQVDKIKQGLTTARENNFTVVNDISHQMKELRSEIKEVRSMLRRLSKWSNTFGASDD